MEAVTKKLIGQRDQVTSYVVLTSTVLAVGCMVFFGFYSAWMNLLGAILFLVANLVSLWCIAAHHMQIAAKTQVAAMVLAAGWGVLFSGGITSPLLIWLLIPSLMAGFIINWQWSAIIGAGYLGYVALITWYIGHIEMLNEFDGNLAAQSQLAFLCTFSALAVGVAYSFIVVCSLKGLLRESLERETRDYLTGLKNRRYLFTRATEEVSRSARYGNALSVLVIDIDHFKSINDRYGHPCGDEVLKAFATRLRATVRDSDIVSRIGGEEFVVLMPETSTAWALKASDRICRMAREIECHADTGESVSMTVSIGVSALEAGENNSFECLFTQADKALYTAKSDSRNCVRFLPCAC